MRTPLRRSIAQVLKIARAGGRSLRQRIWSDAYRFPRGSAQDPGPIRPRSSGAGDTFLTVVARRNARGGRSAQEHLVAALRCLYRRAVDDGLIAEADNPARKVAKPRRLPSTRRAVPDTRLAEINQVAAATGAGDLQYLGNGTL